MSDTKIAAAPDLLTVSKAYVKLPPEKRQQFRHQLRARGISPRKLPIVSFPERGPACLLSHAQERMWFLWRLDPSSAAYNITGAMRLQGALERRAVKAALDQVVARHESLRKYFTDEGGVPMQVTGPADYGWSELEVEPGAALVTELARLTNQPFDLERGPLLRVALLRAAPDDHVLHVAIHHIVSDGLSIDVFVDEFVAAYRVAHGALAGSGEHAVAIAPEIQYGDYATWQREWLDDESLAEQLDYWRKELGAEQPILELPLARTRSGMRNPAGGNVTRTVTPQVVNALRQMSLAGDCTLFMTLLAAYDVLLSRYSGQDDIRVGVPVSGRDRDETERLIGFFVNTLVIRAQMDGVTRFTDLLEQVRTRTLGAYARQDVPFARLVQELQPQRSFGHTPLFQTMFNYLGAEREPIRLPGLTVSDITSELQTARFDLVLWARERGEGLEVSLTYARDVLDEATVSRMLDHYVSLLAQLGARGGDVHLGELVLDTQSTQAALLAHRFEPVGERIVARARRTPQAPAVHCEGARLNYGELAGWSARIARALRARGVGAETRVGLCVTRGPGLVAGLLGVLRSGGAFVPLDPAYPGERLVTMMDDAQVACVLTDAGTQAECGELFAGREAIDIGALDDMANEAIAADATIQPEQLAYVIYTSGSTGRPKGVAVSHVSLGRHLEDFIGTYGISASDTQLQSSTVNFDVALHELLPALMMGGRIEMRGPQLWDIETTSRHLKAGGVTFARIPTAYWQQWLRTPPAAGDLAVLRQITVGGEALPGDALAQWRRGPLAHIRLDNLYGPTETTVACMYRQTRASDEQQTVVSIGEPYGSRKVVVLDRFGNEVPVGGLGELCIGGLTLARGYLSRAGQTAERFVPDPWQAGARLYRSGDLCRRRADGSIDFLGRLDQQVKLRGFRIELGEIEAALRQIDGVSAAVVSLAGEGEARQLVGYVVGTADERVLRRALEARLPGYMVPGSFVGLAALPVMPNGKVDRGSLPTPQARAQRERVAPRTGLEGELLGIWASVLGRQRADSLGVTDNFFEVGGHSLLMMQVASRIRQELGREVSLATLFQHPVLESLAAQLEMGEVRAVGRIDARASGSRIPLTWAQERLWFLWNLEPQSAAYTIAGAVRLRGRLDVGAVRTALERLVRRHESLRTRFVEREGQAWQVVEEVGEVGAVQSLYGWRVERLEHSAAAASAADASNATTTATTATTGHAEESAALEARLALLSREPFDLRAGPMLRVTLLACAADDWVLHFAMPHIVSDAWSQTILLREFSQYYAAATRGEVSEDTALAIQYGDYAVWQRAQVDDAALEAQYAYWERELGGEQPLLALPVDRVRQGAAGSGGAWVEQRVGASLAQALGRVSHAAGATPFMTLLAAFGVVLQGYSAQHDIRVGVPVAGRERLETEGLIGFFVNTVVIRIETPAGVPFSTRLLQVKERVLGAHAHAQVPFAKLVERLQPQRSVSHTPLFQAMFDYSAEGSEPVGLAGMEVSALGGATGTAQFDLSLQVSAGVEGGGLHIALNYATDIFDEATVAGLLASYVRVLEQVATQPEVRTLGLLDEAQRETLARWSAPVHEAGGLAEADAAVDAHELDEAEQASKEPKARESRKATEAQPVHQMIEQQAASHPNEVAVVLGDTRLSYGELNARANRLARHLQRQGVSAEVGVGIAVERSVEMVVALLGIMKAGGAYVPLDPSYPAERLAYMSADSGIGLVLTQSSLVAGLQMPSGVELLELDTLDLSGESADNLDATVRAENLAYVIYTSGSTGQPKGAQLTHGNVSRLLTSTRQWFDFGPTDVWTMFHSYAFDFSVWEIFGALCHGGRLVVVPFQVSRSPEAFLTLLRREGVTVLNQTPSAFRQLMDVPALYDGDALALRLVIFGGEALEPQTLEPWIAHFGDATPQLVNMYGITETTVHVTYRPVTQADLAGHRSPLGRQIPDLGLYVLDAAGDLAPVGVAGELHVSGEGLCRGYLKRPSLTAQRFVPDPFGTEGGRLYRTGDLAKWNRDGELEYLGRIDHQVKLRGFRIELGEIEAALRGHAGVRDAVAAVKEVAGEPMLTGYVVPAQADGGIDIDDVRAELGRRLPAYMVPQRLVTLAALPLTPNGKLDLKALPLPDGGSDATHYVEPHTPTERSLAAIWQQVLGLQRISTQDDFFALGGQSLLALRVMAQLREQFGFALPMQILFSHPVLSALAVEIDRLSAASQAEPLPGALVARAAGSRIPLSPAQERLWFLSRLDPQSPAYNLSGAVELDGTLDPHALRGALAAVVERHESLRTRFVEYDGVAFQQVDVSDYGWSVLDFEDIAQADVDGHLSATLQSLSCMPFSLEDGPLLRITLIRLGAARHVLHFVAHHIVSDAWSIRIMIDDFARAYAAIVDGQAARLAAPPLQYGDYALWQREPQQQVALEGELAFWRRRLGREHSALELPFDRPPCNPRSRAGGRIGIALTPATVKGVRALCRAHQATPFMVLLAAFNLLLERYSGQDDIRIGVPVAGRERIETQGLIGFFVNTLVIRAEMQDVRTVATLLAHVRERVLEAQAHQHVPFSSVVDALSPERDLTQTPLFNVMFNFNQAFDDDTVELPGLRLSPIETSTGTARFDLVLWARERGEGLEVSLTYARDVLDEATVSRMLDHYVSLLAQLGARGGDVHLGELVLDTQSTQAALLAHRFEPVGERIVARARRTPQAPAVHCEGARLNYGELAGWSARIARALRARGVGAETRVGLCVTRGPGLVAGLLGVLRSGGAFVPLDPAYPGERLVTMMDDAQVACVLTDAGTQAECGELFAGREAIDIGALDDMANEAIAADATIQPEQLAYVIYTSGSTGRPKGVAVSHVSLGRHLEDFIGTYGISASDTQLQSSTVNFDVALHELLPALMMGGRIEMRGPQLWDIETTSRHLKAGGVTFARIPTAYWQQWLRTPPAAGDLAVLRQITVGGEALPGDALAQWRRGPLAHIRLDNLYGPTETTVACMYRQTRASDEQQTVVSIGEPYGSRKVVVLDRFGNEVPVGGLGELCIGGLTLARGYLSRAGQTAERFVPDPWQAGARLYRSGDLCRRRADGSIDFLGRLDQQVKLRGFRIELGEIEAALRQIDGVSAAVVSLAGEGEARQLVGYVVGTADERVLRRALEARLPGYMVPGSFVGLAALPVMPNGKVDRGSLPTPQARAQRERVAPRTGLEGELLGIWASVLGRQRADSLGVTDNFFEVGGHSLLMMQVASRIRQELGREVSLATLFQHPVLESLAAQLEMGEVRAVGRIDARASGSRIPLTWAQERLWFLWNLEPQSAAYTIAGAVRLRGRLDVGAVRTALERLVRRHESLRTRFVEREGQAWQVVEEVGEVGAVQSLYGWRVERLEHSAAAASAADASNATTTATTATTGHAEESAALEARLALLSREPFDLRAGPMLRVTLLACAADDWVLHFAMPHIVSDAWSQTILLREFSQYYAAATRGEVSEDTALAIQYGDYAVWQRAQVDDAALEAQYAYWERELGGEQPLLALPVDRVRQGAAGSGGAWVEQRVGASLAQALGRVSHAAGATPFMTLLAAFGVVLQGYSAQHDIRVGVPVAGRERLETEGLIGFFVNTVVIRIETPAGVPFSTRLLQVKERVLGAHAHAQVPFAKLVERLQPQRSVSHTPLFQAMFDYSAEGSEPVGLAGMEVSALGGATGTAQFDLSLQVSAGVEGGGLHIALNYATDIFDEATVAGLLASYVRVLEQVATQPEVRTLGLLDEAQRETLARWSAPVHEAGGLAEADAAVDAHELDEAEQASKEPKARESRKATEAQPVHQMIEQQAASHPNEVAVVLGDTRLSYGELNARANRLARHLQRQGVSAEVGVGIAVERSVEMVVALLGIMKAGGAYVPLDPSYPAERLAYMSADSGIGLVLTQSSLVAGLQMPSGVELLELDTLDLSGESADNLDATVRAENLAYVIYTSGSTGQPKGAQLTHGNVSRLLTSTRQWFDFGPTDVWTMFHSYAFDFSVWEIFGALCHGGRLVVVPFQVSRSPEAFLTLLRREGVTVLNQTPSAFRQLMDVPALYDGDALALRLVIFGGEALEPQTLEPWIAHFGDATPQLVNMYGITETTVHVTYRPVTQADLAGHRSPLGRQIPDLGLYVLDAAGDLAPVGVAGELHVSGEGLCRGYLKRPSLTAQRFVPDPFGTEGGRLYRTGDLAKWNRDGELEYLGRIDHQVKLRGFRIELGEIEAALRGHAGVRDAVAAVKEVAGEPMLTGYVVPAQADGGIDIDDVRAELGRRLPAYMVPQRLVTLAALPLTPNGKLDLKALPLPDGGSDATHYVEPHTPTERSLAAIWQQVLGLQRISTQDDFFALGGDSLRTLQVARLARDAALRGFGIETLFAKPRLVDLAAYLDAWSERLPANIVPMNATNAPSTVFALHPAYGLIAEYRTLARQLDGVASVYGIQLPLYSDPQWWAIDLDALARDYAAQIRQVQPRGPYRLMGWSLGGVLAVEVTAQLEAAGETVEFVGLIDAGMQDNAHHDPLRAAELLSHRRSASSEAIAGFWADAAEDRQRWRALLGDSVDDPETLGHVVLAIEQLQALTANWRPRRVKAPLTLWWASRNLGAEAGEAGIDSRLIEAKTARWRTCSSGTTLLAGVIDADHPGIVQHPALFAGIAARLRGERNEAAPLTGLADA